MTIWGPIIRVPMESYHHHPNPMVMLACIMISTGTSLQLRGCMRLWGQKGEGFFITGQRLIPSRLVFSAEEKWRTTIGPFSDHLLRHSHPIHRTGETLVLADGPTHHVLFQSFNLLDRLVWIFLSISFRRLEHVEMPEELQSFASHSTDTAADMSRGLLINLF